MERANCHLCETRPPRRDCPALGRSICAVCCGSEREQSIGCPLDCPHLREARNHEKRVEPDPATYPYRDIDVSDRFMEQQRGLAAICGQLLLFSAMRTEGCVDSDVAEALESMIQTLKTAQTGLIYETKPSNLIAAGVVAMFQAELAKVRERLAEQSGSHSIRDKDLLGVLVFWRRLLWEQANGRRKGRAFTESLFGLLPQTDPAPGAE